MRLSYRIIAVLGTTVLCHHATYARSGNTVTIATEGNYAPWNVTTRDGAIDGFEPEMLKNLCGRMRVECKIVALNVGPGAMIPRLVAGEVDIIVDSMAISDARKQLIAFSRPYANTPASFAALKSTPVAGAITGAETRLSLTGTADHDRPLLEQLRAQVKGHRIGVQENTIYDTFVRESFADVATLRGFKTLAERNDALAKAEVELIFDDVTYLDSIAAEPATKNLVLLGPQVAGSIWGEGEAAGFRKDDNDLRGMFDTALGAALADGTVKRLGEKWFKRDIAP